MSFLKRHLGLAVLASELSHVFCCVLPTLVTVLGALANLGLATAAPGFILEIHEFLHAYEMPIIVFSGVMVVMGWAIHISSRRVDCHDTGCVHPPCTPKKDNNGRILVIATVLFAINLVVFFGIHRNVLGLEIFEKQDTHAEHEHHEHHEHIDE